MRKISVLFIITLLVISLSGLISADDFAVKVNDEYTISVEEFMSRVEMQKDDLQEMEKKNKVLNDFVNSVTTKVALKEKGLEITEEDFYNSLEMIESDIISKLDIQDTRPLGSSSGDEPPKEEIMERLVEFDETDFTYEQLERSVKQDARIRKVKNYFKEKAEEEFDKNEEEKREELEELKEKSKEDYEEMDKEKQKFNKLRLEEIQNMDFEEYRKEIIDKKATEKRNELLDKTKENLEVEINKEDLE